MFHKYSSTKYANKPITWILRFIKKRFVLRIIKIYQNHPSIKLIKAKNKSQTFLLEQNNIEEIKEYLQKGNWNIHCEGKFGFFAKYICNDINASAHFLKFHVELKNQISYLYIKRGLNSPKKIINILLFFQIFPRLTKDACVINAKLFQRYFLNISMRFSLGLQPTILPISYYRKMEKIIVDYQVVFCALITDLSKAFDFIPHDLIIAKLEIYGFPMDALKLVSDYL